MHSTQESGTVQTLVHTPHQISRPDQSAFVLYKRRWYILAVFAIISMTNEVIWISLSSIASIVKVYYGVSFVAVNWLSMIYMIFYVFVLVSAYVLATKGLKFTIVTGTVLNALGSCLRLIGSTEDGFAYAFAGNASAALAQCFILFVPPTLAAVWFGDSERATASAIGILMNMFGVAVGFLMGGMMVPNSEDSIEVSKGMFKMLLIQAVLCTVLVIICVVVVQDAPKTPPSMSQALIVGSKKLKVTKDNLKCLENDPPKANTQHAEASTPKGEVNTMINPISFLGSLKLLLKERDFHLLMQAYGLYFGLFAACNTVLNQMCIIDFPGEEKKIGLMGFTSILLGMFAIFLAGVWLDKTRQYKLISIVTMLCCAASMLAFTLVLEYSGSIHSVFCVFCVYGFFSYPYMTVGLEHAADITYPIPEGTTSGILLLLGNMYGVILTYVLGAFIDNGRPNIAGYIMSGCYIVCLIAVSFVSRNLRRSAADKLKIKLKLSEAVDELSR